MLRGKLLRHGLVVLDGLDITFDAAPVAPAPWSGRFALPATVTTPQAGGSFQLVLEDGRAGLVFVERVELVGGQTLTYFRGVGPLR
jgi:hypothetical protein